MTRWRSCRNAGPDQTGAGRGRGRVRRADRAYRRELHLHCYRILGSLDAEDALQETLLAAWHGLGGFEGRASMRTWLYRIATTRCLNLLRPASRRPASLAPRRAPAGAHPARTGRLAGALPRRPARELPDPAAGPGGVAIEAREAVSLAFITALQLLPPRQRAVLILRDVLDFPPARWPPCWIRPSNR